MHRTQATLITQPHWSILRKVSFATGAISPNSHTCSVGRALIGCSQHRVFDLERYTPIFAHKTDLGTGPTNGKGPNFMTIRPISSCTQLRWWPPCTGATHSVPPRRMIAWERDSRIRAENSRTRKIATPSRSEGQFLGIFDSKRSGCVTIVCVLFSLCYVWIQLGTQTKLCNPTNLRRRNTGAWCLVRTRNLHLGKPKHGRARMGLRQSYSPSDCRVDYWIFDGFNRSWALATRTWTVSEFSMPSGKEFRDRYF